MAIVFNIFLMPSKILVPGAGLEPASLAANDFESFVYTIFTTRAFLKILHYIAVLVKNLIFLCFLHVRIILHLDLYIARTLFDNLYRADQLTIFYKNHHSQKSLFYYLE